jgi:hypothetical protein
MADKNPVRGMQPMDDYEEMMYRRSPEGKAEMQRGAIKAIGAPAAIVVGGGLAAGEVGKYAKEKREREESDKAATENQKKYGMKKGGKVKSASARADGIAIRGKTRA